MGYKEQMAKAKKDKTAENLTPDFMKWEKKGQGIIGEMMSKNAVASSLSEGEYQQYLFKTDDGLIKFSLGKAADEELKATMVPGGVYEITFEGQEDIGKGKKVNKFQVFSLGGPSFGRDSDEPPPHED